MEEYECTNELRWLEVSSSINVHNSDEVVVSTIPDTEIVLQQAWVGKHSGDVDWRDVPTKIGE